MSQTQDRKLDRQARVAAKLRENLKKRKQQDRARRGGDGVAGTPDANSKQGDKP